MNSKRRNKIRQDIVDILSEATPSTMDTISSLGAELIVEEFLAANFGTRDVRNLTSKQVECVDRFSHELSSLIQRSKVTHSNVVEFGQSSE